MKLARRSDLAGGGLDAGDRPSASRVIRRAVARRAQPTIDDVATAAVDGKDSGRPIAAEIRQPVESHLGAGLAHARVHDDPLAREASAAMGARAFAYGNDVFLGPGESDRDLGLMAHELTHVAQQDGRPLGPQAKITVGDSDAPAEREADAVAAAVTSGARPTTLLVDDGPLGPGQMLKSTFLAALRAQVTDAADAELGPEYSALGCPYLDLYFGRYANRSAAEAEAFLRHWAPAIHGATSAGAIIPLVVARTRAGIQHWRATGQAPTDLPSDARAAAATSAPAAMGPGARLDGGTAARMQSALGMDLSHVRIHTEGAAARMAADHGALALARGPHIAFASGQYQPGTVAGDAILAHELAHVAQQDGATTADGGAEGATALEDDADQVATGVMARLWGGAKKAMRAVTDRIGPSLRSGLAVQRCGGSKPELGKTPSLEDIQWHVNASAAVGAYVQGTFEGGLPIELHYYDHPVYIAHAMKYGREHDPDFAGLSNAEAEAAANDTTAFNDSSTTPPRIIIDKSKSKPAATIHEVMHSYTSSAWRKLGRGVSEGGTEYYARKVAAEAKVAPNEEYPTQTAAVARLAKHAGDDAVAQAFFRGQVDALRTIIDGKHKPGAFDAWCTATNDRDWHADPLCSPDEAAAEDKAKEARDAAAE